jgi:hypothetical protein
MHNSHLLSTDPQISAQSQVLNYLGKATFRTLGQARSTIYLVWPNSATFSLHSSNMKFNKEKEE